MDHEEGNGRADMDRELGEVSGRDVEGKVFNSRVHFLESKNLRVGKKSFKGFAWVVTGVSNDLWLLDRFT